MDRCLIVGAGGAGQELLSELQRFTKETRVIGFVDDKKKGSVENLPVLGTIEELQAIIQDNEIDTIYIAIPSSDGNVMRRIIRECYSTKVKINVVPRISEVINGNVTYDKVRDIQVEDLLGRSIIRQDFSEAKQKIRGKSVMIIGAAGSIGSELVRQIVALQPKKLICADYWENGLFHLEQDVNRIVEAVKEISPIPVYYNLLNIQAKEQVFYAFEHHRPDVVINAAAFKHVPLMEANPREAILNNIDGTMNIFEAAIRYPPQSFILISSDKAVNPANVMGATKRVTEKLMHYYSSLETETSFLAVRFGNVLNSNGSVIPLFKQQIKRGRVTVTHKDIVRYFMTVEEAAQLVIQCWVMGDSDQIFILDMGEPIRIYDLADWMIRLAGKEPGKEVVIEIIGLRPGEKLYEEPLTEVERVNATCNDKIFILNRDEDFDEKRFMYNIRHLVAVARNPHVQSSTIRDLLRQVVPSYKVENDG